MAAVDRPTPAARRELVARLEHVLAEAAQQASRRSVQEISAALRIDVDRIDPALARTADLVEWSEVLSRGSTFMCSTTMDQHQRRVASRLSDR